MPTVIRWLAMKYASVRTVGRMWNTYRLPVSRRLVAPAIGPSSGTSSFSSIGNSATTFGTPTAPISATGFSCSGSVSASFLVCSGT